MSRVWLDEDERSRIDWAVVLEVVKFIGRLIFTVLRIVFIIFMALVIGGFRGASKAKMTSRSSD